MQVVHAVVDGEVGGAAYATAGLQTEEGQTLAVGTEETVFPAQVLGGGFHHHGSSTVAEDGAGGAVGVVHDRRHFVGAAYHNLLVASALHHAGSGIHGKEEAAACSLHINGEGVLHAQASDDDRRRRGEVVVGGGGGHDEAVHFLRVGARFLQQLLHSLAGHVAGAQTFFVKNAALLDADARHDPFVVRIDHARQFVVVEHIFGHVAADARDDSIYLFHKGGFSGFVVGIGGGAPRAAAAACCNRHGPLRPFACGAVLSVCGR